MGIFSFLKKIFSEPEKIEPTKEEINFSDIEELLKKKINENTSKEKEVISSVKKRINVFSDELREKIKAVNAVDIESKEKNDRVKSAVNEGRKKYIEFLEKFMDNIENADEENIEKFTESINSAFLRLNESSGKSYERATILIGKEMGTIKESLKNFSTELINVFNENKEITSTSKRLALIESKASEIKEINEKSKKIDEEEANITNKLKNKEQESKEISEKIEKIRNSQEYLNNIEKEKSIQGQEKQLEKEIYELKQLIDFKTLTNFFHIFEDRMEIVKLYRDDFTEEFKKDKGSRLLNLLNESKLNTESIYDKIKLIHDREVGIEDAKKEIKEDETKSFSSELEKTSTEIKDLQNEIGWAEKKKEKLKISHEENFKLIKEELELMSLNLKA